VVDYSRFSFMENRWVKFRVKMAALD